MAGIDPTELSRQKRWQLKQLASGRCADCGRPRHKRPTYCKRCTLKRRELARQYRLWKSCKLYKAKKQPE